MKKILWNWLNMTFGNLTVSYMCVVPNCLVLHTIYLAADTAAWGPLWSRRETPIYGTDCYETQAFAFKQWS